MLDCRIKTSKTDSESNLMKMVDLMLMNNNGD